MKKDYSVIFIYDDGSITMNPRNIFKDKKIDYKSIDTILIPMLGNEHTQSFIPVPVTKLTTATRVKIYIQMQMTYIGDGVGEYNIALNPEEIDTEDIVEVYNFLFSFLRYEMLNSLEEIYADDDIPMQAIIEPLSFSIEMYRDEKIVYEMKISSNDPSTTKYAKIDKLINKFFKYDKHPLLSKWEPEKVYRLRDDKIETIPVYAVNEIDLIGIGSPYTKTVTFIEARRFMTLKHGIKYACINFLHIDGNSVTDIDIPDALEYHDSIGLDIIPLKSMNYWAHDIYTLLGFMDLLVYYGNLLDIMIKLLYQSKFPDRYQTMKIETVVLVEVEFLSIRTRRTIRKYKLDEIPYLDKFIDDIISYAPYL